MRIYSFVQPEYDVDGNYIGPEIVKMTEEEVLAEYWEFWKSRMERKFGLDHELTSKENCLEDWVSTHWARVEEVPDDDRPEQLLR